MTSTHNDSSRQRPDTAVTPPEPPSPFKFAYKLPTDIAGLPELLPSDLLSPLVQLQFGADLTGDLHAHEKVLCKLPFFKAALRGPFTESTTKTVKMPEDDPEIVPVLVEYLYSGDYKHFSTSKATNSRPVIDRQIHGSTPSDGDAMLSSAEVKVWQKVFHARVFVLAEKYDCQGLCDLAVKRITDMKIKLDESTVGLFVEYMLMVYDFTTAGSRLRLTGKASSLVKHNSLECGRFLGRMWADNDGRRHLDEAFAQCPELAVDILRLIAISAAGLAESGAAKPGTTTPSWCYVPGSVYNSYSGVLQQNLKNPYVDAASMVF